MSNETERIVWYDVSKQEADGGIQMITDLTKEHPDKILWRFLLPLTISILLSSSSFIISRTA